jgi:hypothetical protein
MNTELLACRAALETAHHEIERLQAELVDVRRLLYDFADRAKDWVTYHPATDAP